MKFTSLRLAAAAGLIGLGLGLAAPVLAAEQENPPRAVWSFSGPFGMFDRAQLQRGFQVYKDVCAACHGLNQMSFRNLSQPGGPEFPADQVAQIAADWIHKVREIGDDGQPAERAPRPADRIPGPFANVKAAEAAHNGKAPPDLSLMAKARSYERGFPWFLVDIFTMYQEHGTDYLKAFLTGYEANHEVMAGLHYNKYFPGNAVAMPNILQDGLVTYSDGSPATARQYAADVTAFLMWTAEPHLEQRKRIGFQVLLFLLVMSILLYFTKKRVWSSLEGHA
ncbi:cytochrome c1 [Phreatobacter stygius]|uniref:Cytochrome c1 n=1 Tax=Phreatobacter stygius TaxID=1940610 RepID=A0A4D7AUT4_9HYPH|nr:cytochrome c1 [Phreatobacter stygius]QCI63451.1 cytochrome c1 [Phreatobacter stygius]